MKDALKFRPKSADRRNRIRVFMFGRFRHFLPAAVWVLGVATAWADAGYLPLAGPMPLRFRVPAPPVSDQVNAPVAPAVAAPIILPTPPMPPGPKEPANAQPIQSVTNGAALEYNARPPAISSGPVMAPDPVISPQMLIKYFTAPTNAPVNANTEGVTGPVGFTPPMMASPTPLPPPSSKVTYSIPPDPK
jgi:hypothetical protein